LQYRSATPAVCRALSHTAKLDIGMFAQARFTLDEPEPGPTHPV
jgi:hypothetical protein